jgi:integrase
MNRVRVLGQENPALLSVDSGDYFFITPDGTPIDESNFYKRERKPILKAKKIRPRPFYNTRHRYLSFLFRLGRSRDLFSSQTGDSIKTLETDYGRYIREVDSGRDFSSFRSKIVQPRCNPPTLLVPKTISQK